MTKILTAVIFTLILCITLLTACDPKEDPPSSECEHIVVIDEAVLPTCSRDGLTEGQHCSLCKEVLVKQEVLPKVNHTITTVEMKQPTCTEDGYTAHSLCTVCGHTDGYKALTASHSLVLVEARPATCTEDGYTEYKRCTACEYTEGYEVLAASHSLVLVEARPATCTESGYTAHKRCTACEYTEGYEVLTASHSLVLVEARPATCTEDGYDEYYACTSCEYTTEIVVRNASHDLVRVNGAAADCHNDGYYDYEYCTRCTYSTYQTIPAHHSTVSVGYKPATCTEDGHNAYEYCTECTYTTYEIILAKHTIVYIDAKEATCIEDGYDAYEYCMYCDYTTLVKIPAHHNIVLVDYLAPTCYVGGHNAYEYCSRCDYTTYSSLPASHQLVWIDEKAPTCTEEGYYGYDYCTACGFNNKQTIPKTDHTLMYESAQAPTCAADGHNEYEYCKNCNYTTFVGISKVDHKYSEEWTIDVPATEEQDGVISHHCVYGCGAKTDTRAYSYEYYTEGLKFTMLSGGTWEVSMGDAEEGIDIIVPKTYLGIAVTHVGEFDRSINSIELPEGITEICYGAFYGIEIKCGRLTLPSTVKYIRSMSLYYCGLYSIDFGSSAPYVSYDAIGSSLHEVRVDSLENWFVICQNYSILQHLGHLYVNGELLEGNVVIPDGCTSIPQNAFTNQMHVTSVTIPASVKVISSGSMKNSGITDVYYEGTLEQWCSVVMYDGSVTGSTLHIGGVKVEGELVIPNSVTSIGDYAFANQAITSLVLHSGVKVIGKQAFSGTMIDKLVIPGTVELIKESAFAGLTLTVLDFPFGEVALESYVFSGLTVDSLTIPEGIKELSEGTFEGSEIDTLVLPSSLEKLNGSFYRSIIDTLYYNCAELSDTPENAGMFGGIRNIRIGDKVRSIPDMAFTDSWAESLDFSQNKVLTSIGSRAFEGMYRVFSIILPETVTYVAEDAFADCTYVRYAYCPKGATLTLASAPEAIIGDELIVSDSFVFLVSGGQYYLFGANKTLSGEVVLPLHPTGEAEYNLIDLPYSPELTSLTIPKTATLINNIFDNTPSLEALIIEGRLEYLYISGHGIKRLEILGEVVDCPIFAYDEALEYLVLGQYVTEIPDHAFAQCTALSYVELSNSLKRVGIECFRNCISLRYLLIPNSVTYMENPASEWTYVGLAHASTEDGYFSGYYHVNVKEYGYDGTEMWYIDNDGVKHMLEVMELPDEYDDGISGTPSVPTEPGVIGEYTYDGVHSYDIVDGVYVYRAYLGDTSTGIVVLPESINGHRYVIGEYAFYNRDWLVSVTVRGVDVIEERAFTLCENLTTVILEEGLRVIQGAFGGCSSLTTVTIPKSVCFINTMAFYECESLESVVFLNPDGWYAKDAWYPCHWQRCPECIALAFREYYVAYGAYNIHTKEWYDYIN